MASTALAGEPRGSWLAGARASPDPDRRVQDTNRSEYLPLRLLAEEHKRLSFFGDIDQTIYGWRGSPHEVLAI